MTLSLMIDSTINMPPALWTVLILGNYALAALALVKILRHPREPRAMMAWILSIILLPFVGLLVFMLIGQPRLERAVQRRRRRRQQLAIPLSKKNEILKQFHGLDNHEQLAEGLPALMRLAKRVSTYAPTHSNRVTIYHDENGSIQKMREAIESACSHIHLEYYMFKPDDTGRIIRDALIVKARQGVQCRVLMDYIGSWSTRTWFTKPMTDAGVEVAFFLPVVPWQGPWRINFRNHRKMLIVDGKFGFTGSHNIGNEYRGWHPTLGHWQDTNLSLEGPSVQQLQEVFVEDWHYSTGTELLSDEYFPTPTRGGQHIVQAVPSGPDTDVHAIHDVVFAAIGAAKESLSIVTPYFVPDAATLQAMQSAAYRGVKVQLIIPSRSDAKLPLWAGRSFYHELHGAGVHIYEYDHGMLHNKIIVVDDCFSILGSANMDHRSFRLNFELSILLYDTELAAELSRDIEQFKKDSRRIMPMDGRFWGFWESLAVGAARVISPLL